MAYIFPIWNPVNPLSLRSIPQVLFIICSDIFFLLFLHVLFHVQQWCVCSNTSVITYGVCTCMCFCDSAHSCVQRQKRKSSLPLSYFLAHSLETGSLNGRVPVLPAQGSVLNHYFYRERDGEEEAKVAGSQQALVRSSCI